LVAKINTGYERKADQEERIRGAKVANINSTFSADVPF
jgi:hypothetical protein